MRESSACICKSELRVGDRRAIRARRGAVAFLDLQRSDRAADARARDELMNGLDRGDDRLLVGDFGAMDDEKPRGETRLRRRQNQDGEE